MERFSREKNCSPSFGEAIAKKKLIVSTIVSIFESKMALLASLSNCFTAVTNYHRDCY